MITYDIKINNVPIKKVDIVNILNHPTKTGVYYYEVNIYDFQAKTHTQKQIEHKRSDNEGILLSKALKGDNK